MSLERQTIVLTREKCFSDGLMHSRVFDISNCPISQGLISTAQEAEAQSSELLRVEHDIHKPERPHSFMGIKWGGTDQAVTSDRHTLERKLTDNHPLSAMPPSSGFGGSIGAGLSHRRARHASREVISVVKGYLEFQKRENNRTVDRWAK